MFYLHLWEIGCLNNTQCSILQHKKTIAYGKMIIFNTHSYPKRYITYAVFWINV